MGEEARFPNQYKTHGNWSVEVANSDTVFVSGTVDLDITIQTHREAIRFLVIPMAEDMHLILGNNWLCKRKAILDYNQMTVSPFVKGGRVSLKPDHAIPAISRSHRPPAANKTPDGVEVGNVEILNFIEAKRVIKTRDDWMVLQLHHVVGSEDWNEAQFMAAKASVVTPEESEASVRAAIERLKDEVEANKLRPATEIPDPDHEEQSKWLDDEVVKLLDTVGDKVFREKLPGVRQEGEDVEAIPIVPGKGPIARGMFRYTQAERDELKKQITTLLEDGMIEPSLSPWAASALVVPKYNPDKTVKGWRMVIDYRLLNAMTVRFQFPMPRMDDVLDAVGGSKYFTSSDATWGF